MADRVRSAELRANTPFDEALTELERRRLVEIVRDDPRSRAW